MWYNQIIDPYTMFKFSSDDTVLGNNSFNDLFSNTLRISNILMKSNK